MKALFEASIPTPDIIINKLTSFPPQKSKSKQLHTSAYRGHSPLILLHKTLAGGSIRKNNLTWGCINLGCGQWADNCPKGLLRRDPLIFVFVCMFVPPVLCLSHSVPIRKSAKGTRWRVGSRSKTGPFGTFDRLSKKSQISEKTCK